MGIREIKDSFNLVADPDAIASVARLGYQAVGSTQCQRLTFAGSWADGSRFEIRSDLVRPNGDLVIAARQTAAALLATKGISR